MLADVQEKDYYWYVGSKTTPPCESYMEYVIVKQVFPISANQLSKFRALF